MAMACCGDHAAGLVPGDHAGRPLDATRDDSTRIGRGAVGVQVAAAHAPVSYTHLTLPTILLV